MQEFYGLWDVFKNRLFVMKVEDRETTKWQRLGEGISIFLFSKIETSSPLYWIVSVFFLQ